MSNSIFIISPYRLHNTWVFDDPSRDVRREPFVAGIPEIIDAMLGAPRPHRFTVQFSGVPFPTHQFQLHHVAEQYGGEVYTNPVTKQQGWFCPCFYKYFPVPPKTLFLEIRR